MPASAGASRIRRHLGTWNVASDLRERRPTVSIPKAQAAAASSTISNSEWEPQPYSQPIVPKHDFELVRLPLENQPRYMSDHSGSSSSQSWSADARRRESDPLCGRVTNTQELSASAASDVLPVEPTPFIFELSHIHELTEHSEYIRWSRDGKSILLASHHPNLLRVLSQYFNFTTISSLIRQLNIYSFKRLTTTPLLEVLELNQVKHALRIRLLCSLGDFKPSSKQRSRKSRRRHSAGDEPATSTRQPVLSRDYVSMGYFGELVAQ
ncbi:BQ2448_4844 [Microbotryum intermedium]|uniref:BQ2448_4844 protein n=1 Tax=Microbotryum intermedium TaxID=269621 RepID=A0A238FE94_9BASI|nr:BQ2448_4844 [Microbotryum intermedium]